MRANIKLNTISLEWDQVLTYSLRTGNTWELLGQLYCNEADPTGVLKILVFHSCGYLQSTIESVQQRVLSSCAMSNIGEQYGPSRKWELLVRAVGCGSLVALQGRCWQKQLLVQMLLLSMVLHSCLHQFKKCIHFLNLRSQINLSLCFYKGMCCRRSLNYCHLLH